MLDWTAQVTQYISPQLVTISQIAPPEKLTAAEVIDHVYLKWLPSAAPGVTYNAYRSTQPGPEGRLNLVASGLTGTDARDGPYNNLLKNSSFENGLTFWNRYSHYHSTCCDSTGADYDYSVTYWSLDAATTWAGGTALKVSHSDTGTFGAYQDVTTDALAGTTFTLSVRLKGIGVSEAGTTGPGVQLTYTDGTSAVAYASMPSGTFDWTPVQASITATKTVKSVRALVRIYGSGTAWFDAVQLDTVGAAAWYSADALDFSKTYYYRVAAVAPTGEQSAPTEDAPTSGKVSQIAGLGIKGFWPYSPVALPAGTGDVNVANGNLAYATTDLVYPGRLLTTVFLRTYNAQGSSASGPLGYGWDHSFNWSLTPAGNGAMLLKEGDGATFTFQPDGSEGAYLIPPGSRMRLIKNGDRYTLVRYDHNLLYEFSGGKLQRIAEPNGNSLTLAYDSAGHLASVTDPAGKALRFEYTGNLITRVLHPGYPDSAVRFEYDDQGHLVRSFDLENHAVNYEYDDFHQLIKVTDANGNATQVRYLGEQGSGISYNPNQIFITPVSAVIYPDGATQSFAYGTLGEMVGWTKSTVTDGRGFTVTYQVDGKGLLKKQTFPYGTETPANTQTASVLYEHDGAWNVTKYTDPRGKLYLIAYDGYGNPMTVSDPDNNVTQSLFTLKPYPGAPGQQLNLPVLTRDALGNTTTILTDDRGNVVRVEDALLQRTEFTYEQTGLRTSATDANGHVTRYSYDPNGWLREQTDATGAATAYRYDDGGNLSLVTDPLDHQTAYRYDRLGRQAEVTNPDGTTQRFRYDAAGNLVETTDPAGAVTRYDYDGLGRLIKLHQWPETATEHVTLYEYNQTGQPKAVTDPRGKKSTFSYDGAGRKLIVANPLGQKTTYGYDAAGNAVKITNPLGYAATAEYDNLNRQTKTSIPQDGTYKLETTVAYDALGRPTSQKDGLGNTTTYDYDSVGRLAMVVDPMGFGTTYAYDRVGNRLAVTDAQRRTTQYVYDPANRVTEEKRPDGVSVSIKYDAAGRQVATTNGRNQTMGYRYDDRNRLVDVNYPDGRFVKYAYDNTSRRTSMTDWNGTTRYQYNLLGWLTQTEDSWGHQLNYAYDAAGSRTSVNLRYTGVDYTWTYGYDDAGRLTSLQSPGVASANTLTYDVAGQLTKLSYANSDIVNHTYDQAGELKSISSSSKLFTAVLQFTYAYDSAGQRTSISRSGSGVVGGTVYYKYDAGSRLTSAGPSTLASDREFYYDLVGNRHTMVLNTGDPKGVYTYVHDQANRLIEEFGPLPSTLGGGRSHESYTYDGEGSQTRAERDGKEVTLYAYDEQSRLLKVTNPLGQITRYTYNGDGQRVRMAEPAGTTIFIYDGNEVLAEADATGAIQVLYTRTGSGRLISQWQKGETYWYHLDGLGSTVALTDESGKIRNKYGYDEYGNLDPGSTQEVMNRYTFTGQAWDSSAGLYHYKARYYSPTVGRFLTQDTWKGNPWQPWTQNLYVYVGNNPVNYIDPTGHRAVREDGGGVTGDVSDEVKVVESSDDRWERENIAACKELRQTDEWAEPGFAIGCKWLLGDVQDEDIDLGFAEAAQGIGALTLGAFVFFTSIKMAPSYPKGFQAARDGTVKVTVKNEGALNELRQVKAGEWRKVYKDGMVDGRKASIHYFEHADGTVWRVEVKDNWSNDSSWMP